MQNSDDASRFRDWFEPLDEHADGGGLDALAGLEDIGLDLGTELVAGHVVHAVLHEQADQHRRDAVPRVRR